MALAHNGNILQSQRCHCYGNGYIPHFLEVVNGKEPRTLGFSIVSFLKMSLPSVKYYGEGNLPAVNMIEGSIGYSVGAVLGAALAARELPDGAERRVILFVGEGSLQLTVQEISTIIRTGLKPILYSPSLLYRF